MNTPNYPKTNNYPEISAILFDLGNVLVPINYTRALDKLVGKSELRELRREQVADIFRKESIHQEYESGKLSTKEFIEKYRQLFARITGNEVDISFVTETFCDIFDPLLIEEDFLRMLKKRYKLSLLSNTNELHINYIKDRYSVLNLFDELYLSYELKSMKPEPEIYRTVTEKLNLRPENILFIDDLEANIEGAKACGWNGILFTGRSNLEIIMRNMELL